MSLGGAHLSMDQRLAALKAAGWPDVMVTDADGDTNPLLVIMLAISEKESSGYAGAHSEDPSVEDSWGLWQINRYAHPEYSVGQLQDPVTNARAALAIYQAAGSLDPWGPWQTGIYADAMPQAWAAYQMGGGAALGASPISATPSLGNSGNWLLYGLGAVLLYSILSD